jgi:hypothetical protein
MVSNQVGAPLFIEINKERKKAHLAMEQEKEKKKSKSKTKDNTQKCKMHIEEP